MPESSAKQNPIVETIKTVVYAVLLAGVIRTLLFQPYWIPSGSMKDTLLIGDFLFVNKFAYGYSTYSCPMTWMCPFSGRIMGSMPERGDVIVFAKPGDGTVYIKRLVGLPGDKIQMKAGVLHINGEPARQTPLPDFVETYEPQGGQGGLPQCANGSVAPGGDCIKKRYLETQPTGISYNVLDIRAQRTDDTMVFHVPEGQFFFMGDNRDNSADSRVEQRVGGVGFVPFENLIGRADRVIFSSAGRSILYFWTWRKDRFFKAVN